MQKIILFFLLLLIAGCDNQKSASNPAQQQTDDYTNSLQKYKGSEKSSTQPSAGPISDQQAQNSSSVQNQSIPSVQTDSSMNTGTDTKESVQQSVQKDNKLDDFLGIQDGDMVLGDRQSKVVVIEYFSHTCTHCVFYHKTVFPEVKSKYIDTNKIAYVIREFIASKQDLDAAILARCSKNINDFLKFSDVLLQQQENWAWNKKYQEILTNIGQLGGVSKELYTKCLNDQNLTSFLVANSRNAFKSPKFVGTPAFFINGTQFTSPYSFQYLSQSIDKALSEYDKN